MGFYLFLFQVFFALGFFVSGGIHGSRFVNAEWGKGDKMDAFIALLLIDNGLAVCLWIYLTNS